VGARVQGSEFRNEAVGDVSCCQYGLSVIEDVETKMLVLADFLNPEL
jgi:hypothetical protein